MTSHPLAATTLDRVSDQLKDFGSSLQGQNRTAIQTLLETLEDGLTGTLSPHYHLSALDPGIGKSLSVSSFLQAWKGREFKPASSVLIGLSRLQEIENYVKGAGFSQDDVAVLTSSEEHNALGVAKAKHSLAPIMFTTQQMIERRTRGRSFAEAAEFHYQGSPRTLRIWDESLTPAEGLVLSSDEVACLPGFLRSKAPELAAAAQRLVMDLWQAECGDHVQVDEAFSALTPRVLHGADERARAALDTVFRLAGQEAVIVDGRSGDKLLVSASSPLPFDFAPVVILDASGRVRSTYDIWEKSGGPLVRLPSATNDYSSLRVHLWERPVGQVAIQAPGVLEDTVKALAEVIDGDAASQWLIVTYKNLPIEGLLRAALKCDPCERIRFLTWGMHHGTNDFADCNKVVLIGQLTYGNEGYLALAAACGASVADGSAKAEAVLKSGEYRHNLLQALTRASVRRSVNGFAGICTAYIIASPNVGAGELLPEVFPGCIVERWYPDLPDTGGRAGQLIELLRNGLRDRAGRMSKAQLIASIGIKKANFSRLLKQKDVRVFMESRHILNERNELVLPRGFDPWPGGGFTVSQLDDPSAGRDSA